jgi:hypothetical protein
MLAANWLMTSHILLRPSVYSLLKDGRNTFIAGSEVQYIFKPKSVNTGNSTSVFAGGWYNSGNFTTVTGGIELRSFRIGLGYDFAIKPRYAGLEIALRYMAPSRLMVSRYRPVASAHF